jgi:hypothetical protein
MPTPPTHWTHTGAAKGHAESAGLVVPIAIAVLIVVVGGPVVTMTIV